MDSRRNGAREVWGLICLVRHNPRDREGLVFGYKGACPNPWARASPSALRAFSTMLTATDNTYALAWRERCRSGLALRAGRAAKPTPKPGDVVVLAEPILSSRRAGRSLPLRGGLLAGARAAVSSIAASWAASIASPTKDRVYRIEGRRGAPAT